MDEKDFKQLQALADRYGYCSLLENIVTTLPPSGQRCRDAQALADKLSELDAWVGKQSPDLVRGAVNYTVLTGHSWYARISPTKSVVRFHRKEVGQAAHTILRGKTAKDAATRLEGLDTALGVDLTIEGLIAETNVD